MAITYTWKITGVKKAPSLDGLSNVITHVNFDYTGSKGSGASKKESTFHGACPVGAPDSESFIDIDKVTEANVIEWAKKANEYGAGELLLTSMDMDGNKEGYDLELLNEVSKVVDVPVIASGGAGTNQHILDAFLIGRSDAVLAASIFHFGELKINCLN